MRRVPAATLPVLLLAGLAVAGADDVLTGAYGGCAMLVANGTFVYRDDRPAAAPGPKKAPPSGEVEMVVVRRGTRMQVWVDGAKMVEAEVDGSPRPVGIGVHTGTAEFRAVRVRELQDAGEDGREAPFHPDRVSASRSAATWSGVVPQQPPTTRAPASRQRTAAVA